MKGKSLIKLATDRIVLHNISELAGSVLLCCVMFILLAILLFVYEINHSLRSRLDDSLRNGCNRFGYFSRENESDIYRSGMPNQEEFLMSLDCVEAAGTWGYSICTLEELAFLKDIQQDHVIMGNITGDQFSGNQFTDGQDLEEILMSASGWDMFRLELYEGAEPEQYDIDRYNLLYLGYEFRDAVEVGTVIQTSSGTMIVAGILKKGVTIPIDDPNMLSQFSISSAYPTDYSVIEVMPFPIGSPAYFSVKDGYSFEEAQEIIQQTVKDRGWVATVGSVDGVLDAAAASWKPVQRYLIQMIVVIGLTVCIIFSCYQTILILVRRSEYGILYANGATTKDLIMLLLIENAVKILVAFLLFLPIFLIVINHLFLFYNADQYVLQWIIWGK